MVFSVRCHFVSFLTLCAGMEHVYQISQPYLQPAVNHHSSLPEYYEATEEESLENKESSPETAPRSTSSTTNTTESLSGDVIPLLQKYHKLPIPNPGQTVEFKFPSSKVIYFARPLIDEEDEALREWALPLALYTLTKKHLFNMFNACILEKKVAFVSSNLRILSAVVYVHGFIAGLQYVKSGFNSTYETIYLPICLHTNFTRKNVILIGGTCSFCGGNCTTTREMAFRCNFAKLG